jgi:RNA polymerase sigma factor (sigma-70 family)
MKTTKTVNQIGHQIHTALNRIEILYPKYQWLKLTLATTKCSVSEGGERINQMSKAYARLMGLKAFPGKGSLRLLQISEASDGLIKPEIICLILCPAEATSRKYVSNSKWKEMWKRSMRSDQELLVYNTFIKDIRGSLPDYAKEMINHWILNMKSSWYENLTKNTNIRRFNVSGILAQFDWDLSFGHEVVDCSKPKSSRKTYTFSGDYKKSINDQPTSQTDSNSKTSIGSFIDDVHKIQRLSKHDEEFHFGQYREYQKILNLRTDVLKTKRANIYTALAEYDRLDHIYSHTHSDRRTQRDYARWARAAMLEENSLRQKVELGRQEWANLAKISIKKLSEIEKNGIGSEKVLIESNLQLLIFIAKQYRGKGIDFMDLIQEGAIALKKAISRYKSIGYRFASYAYPCIKFGVINAFYSYSNSLSISKHQILKLSKIDAVAQKIRLESGKEPSTSELAQELRITEEAIDSLLATKIRASSIEALAEAGRHVSYDEKSDVDTADVFKQAFSKISAYLSKQELAVLLEVGKCENEDSYPFKTVSNKLELKRSVVETIYRETVAKLRSIAQQQPEIQDLLTLALSNANY